jgi:hypothetical protein
MMGRACGTHVSGEKCIKNVIRKNVDGKRRNDSLNFVKVVGT